jgi:carboxypeptidase Taq
MTATPAMDALEARFRRLSALDGAAGVLGWDQMVMMPAGGAEARAEQTAVLSVLRHELLTDPAVADLLAAAESEALDPWRAANRAEMRRSHAHATALSSDLVEAKSRAASRSEALWRDARAQADFARVAEALGEVVRLTREAAEAKAEALGTTSYEALLDAFEPGGSVARIEALFAELEAALPPILEAVLERQARSGDPVQPHGPFPVDAQRRLMAVIHETGHALYERGLPAGHRHQPVGDARGMVLHESQSLLMEMQACRSPAFLSLLSGWARDAFAGDGAAWDAANLQRIYTRVERGFIRVEADEITYPLHVILRTRLERALLVDDLAVADLPDAWNAGMRDLLGVVPPDDAMGCLQDIHWFDGAIGYFPTYTLGALAAAQLFQAALRADPGIPAAIAAGDFAPLRTWLGTHVHGRGSSASTDEILRDATGSALGTEAFLAHLRARYLDA